MVEDKFIVTMEDKDGNTITDEQLKHIVVDIPEFYERMKVINKRIKEDYHFDKVY